MRVLGIETTCDESAASVVALRDGGGGARLGVTQDAVKDQTYFLAHLSQQQLSRTIFPLGPLTKVAKVLPLSALPG